MKHAPISDADFLTLLDSGASYSDIQNLTGCSRHWIADTKRRLGLTITGKFKGDYELIRAEVHRLFDSYRANSTIVKRTSSLIEFINQLEAHR